MLIKVLYLINHAGNGGTERYVSALARGSGITPFFAYNEEGLLAARMRDEGVPVFRLKMKSRFDLKAAFRLARLCRKHGIEVIHTHFLRENYIALLSKLFYAKPRVVYTYHILSRNGALTVMMNRIASLFQHCVISVCEAGREYLAANGFSGRLITVIHNGIDTDAWACPAREGGKRGRETVFIYATRLVAGKGHEFLLNCASLIKDKPFKLVLAGGGELLDDMRTLSQKLGIADKTVFTGFCEDVRALLEQADVSINASESETLSMNILEAMAAGLPVIATDAGGNPELLRTGCGILVPYGDARAMASAMLDMMENPEKREAFGQASLAAANGEFNISSMLSKTKTAYGG